MIISRDSSASEVEVPEQEVMASAEVITPIIQESMEEALSATVDLSGTANGGADKSCNSREANVMASYDVGGGCEAAEAIRSIMAGTNCEPPVSLQLVLQPRRSGECPKIIEIPVNNERERRLSRMRNLTSSLPAKGQRTSSFDESQSQRQRRITVNVPVVVQASPNGCTKIIPKRSCKAKNSCRR